MGQLFLLWGPWEKSKVSLKAKAKKVYGWGGHFLFININSFFFTCWVIWVSSRDRLGLFL